MSLLQQDQDVLNQLNGLINDDIVQNLVSNELGYQSQDNRITHLNLKGCNLPYVPTNINDLMELKELNVSDNGLQKIPLTICEILNLENLNLSGNKISSLPDDIHKLSNLKILDIRRNNLIDLPETIFNLRNIHTILTKGNPFRNEVSVNVINDPNRSRHLLSHFGGPLRLEFPIDRSK